eukprot:15302855-Alexandrium_andersonii.AAC.1
MDLDNTYVLPYGLDAFPSPAAMPAPVLAEQQGGTPAEPPTEYAPDAEAAVADSLAGQMETNPAGTSSVAADADGPDHGDGAQHADSGVPPLDGASAIGQLAERLDEVEARLD